MLSRPEHGWAEVRVGEHRLPVSHIQPVPEMLLTAFIRALSTGGTADVSFDAEGWTWRMEAGEETRLTIRDCRLEIHRVPVGVHALARAASADICRDLDAWSEWCGQNAAAQRETLIRLCSRLEALLK